MNKPKAILSFDVEFWYNGEFMGKYPLPDKTAISINDSSELAIEKILNLLNENKHRATFFVLGEFAEKHPGLIKKISEKGHEISSHGYFHRPVYRLSSFEFKKEIDQSKAILKEITGKEPLGFRAPNFSINNNTEWAEEIINDNFQYSSSIHPLSFLKKFNSLKEFPPSLGGFYFRVLPLCLYLFLTKLFSRSKIPILYFHHYELFNFTPKIEWGAWLRRKIKYIGTKTAWKKFQNLQEKFEFISFKDYFYENNIN